MRGGKKKKRKERIDTLGHVLDHLTPFGHILVVDAATTAVPFVLVFFDGRGQNARHFLG